MKCAGPDNNKIKLKKININYNIFAVGKLIYQIKSSMVSFIIRVINYEKYVS